MNDKDIRSILEFNQSWDDEEINCVDEKKKIEDSIKLPFKTTRNEITLGKIPSHIPQTLVIKFIILESHGYFADRKYRELWIFRQ